MKRVVLHIDSLVLKGFRNEDRHGIAEGLQQELSRMFADPQAVQQLTANGDVSRLRVGSIHIGQNLKPQRVGLQVAQGIGKGMKI
jgi:microcystin degradation protein MlrC